jgi:serine/threonine protein kinase
VKVRAWDSFQSRHAAVAATPCDKEYSARDDLTIQRMALTRGTPASARTVGKAIGAATWGRSTARDTRLDRTVVIRALPQQFAADAAWRQFECEARAISSLSHPHICHLYDVGHHDGRDFPGDGIILAGGAPRAWQ